MTDFKIPCRHCQHGAHNGPCPWCEDHHLFEPDWETLEWVIGREIDTVKETR